MTIAKVLSVSLIASAAAVGVWGSAPAFAQGVPADAVMLVPGVYTTPEISAKCQAFAAKRVVGGSNTDSSRQAVALACAKKLWDREIAKHKGKSAT
jgi:hypothetical protein